MIEKYEYGMIKSPYNLIYNYGKDFTPSYNSIYIIHFISC